MTIKNKSVFSTVHSLWLFILLMALFAQLLNMAEYVRYDRYLILDGQFWLLLSGNFVHLNWTHLALNMAGLAIVALFFSAQASLVEWLRVIFIASLCVGMGLYWFHPEIIRYVGLSGVLHGLFVFGAIREIKRYPASGYALLALLAVKLIWEVTFGALPGSEDMTGGSVITDAHLFGAIGGLLATGLIALSAKYKR